MIPTAWRERWDAVLGWFPRHAGWVLLATLAATAGSVLAVVDPRSGALRISFDASTESLLPDDDASLRFFQRVREIFGGDETMVVALAGEQVFTAEVLERVKRLTARIQALEGVDRVLSITNAVDVRGGPDGVEIVPFVSEAAQDAVALEALRRALRANPIYGASLVSPDDRATALLVYFLPMSDREFIRRGLDHAITQLAEEEKGAGEIWVTGGPHLRAVSARIQLGEISRLSVLVLAALGLVLALSFRSALGVLVPLATVAVAVLWTLGAIALRGEALNAVTVLVPTLLTALGLSYSVHVVAEHDAEARDDPGGEPRARVARATRRVAVPVALTGLTTAVGFASLSLSPLRAVREFGLLTVFGVLLTLVASLTFTPAALAVLGRRRRVHAEAGGRRRIGLEQLAERIARFDVTHRRAIFGAAAAVFALALVGASQLRVGTQQISKFRADAPVRTDFEAVNRHFGGANPFYVIVESDAPDAFKEPANLRTLRELQEWLDSQPEIGATTSLVDYLALINRGFHEDDPRYFAIPESRRLVSQLLLFGGSEELDRFVDTRYQMVSLHVRADVIDSDRVQALSDRIERRLAALPGHLKGSVTGTAVVFTRALDSIMRGQAASVVAALGIIFLILSAMFVSVRIGFLALLPNVLPVAAYFGMLGFSGVRLSPGTSLIAPMVIGIAVDDTIHYFARFIREVRRTADERRATLMTLKVVGRPVTYTSLALCLGFLMMGASEMRTNAELGALAAFSLAFAWLTDLTLTPALCARLRIATLWDFLSVDLGREPQRAIALLRGMRASQARIVALLSDVLALRAGDRLFAEGEPGEAVYAVLDGRLRASVLHDGRRIELAVHGRGDVVGEIGLFRAARMADVDAVTDARLLRLTEDSIDQLARRYPRIATAVHRNLSQHLAARMARTRAWLEAAATGSEPAAEEMPPRERPAIATRSRALADAFFRSGGAGDREALRGVETTAAGAEAAARACGEADAALVRLLAPLGLAADALAALALVPLAAVAWADGRMDASEREAVRAGARSIGIPDDAPAMRLLGLWLEVRPPEELLARWREAVAVVCEGLSVESRMRLRDGLIGHARAVAEAAGGFLGVGTVSRREEATLAELERAFAPTARESC